MCCLLLEIGQYIRNIKKIKEKKYKSYLLLSALACKTFLFLIFNRENVLGNRARKYVVHQNNLFPEPKKSLFYIYIYI